MSLGSLTNDAHLGALMHIVGPYKYIRCYGFVSIWLWYARAPCQPRESASNLADVEG
jgi:hypothetical protein